MRPSFFHHLHPPTIPAAQAQWRYTFGAGGIAVMLVLVLLVTGALEMFFYIPTPDQAGPSIQTIAFLVPFGGVGRNLHYWAAQALIVAVVVHLLRVVFTGAYVPPRRFNYLLGLALLVLSLLLDFTGYALRWDEGVRWALVAGTNLLRTVPWMGGGLYALAVGGPEPGGATLIRFYAWHVFGLILPLVILSVWHLFRVRRDGGIAVPPPTARASAKRISRNELVRREALAALVAGVALLALALWRAAPLAPPITIGSEVIAETRAPWFFLWVQQLLRWGDPFWAGVFVPLALTVGLALIPYLLPAPPRSQLGRWFPPGGRLAQIIVGAIALLMIGLTMLALYP